MKKRLDVLLDFLHKRFSGKTAKPQRRKAAQFPSLESSGIRIFVFQKQTFASDLLFLAKGLLLIILLCAIVNAALDYSQYKKEQTLLRKQEALVKVMNLNNVNLEEYPYFPVDYFDSVIKPGMTLDEVHHIVIDYEAVYNNGDDSEVYYYFSTDDKDAVRIMIRYDWRNEYQVNRFSGVDENSSGLTVNSWNNGLLEK